MLWPNPSNGVVHLATKNISARGRIVVCNAMGQVVRRFNTFANADGTFTLDLRDLSPGPYRVNVEDGPHRVSIALALMK